MKIQARTRLTVFCLALAVAIAGAAEDSFFDRQLDRQIVLLKGDMGSPKAFLHLYSIWDLADFCRWDGRVPGVLNEILACSEATPLLKGYSLWFLREVDLRKGDFEGARQKQTRLGFLTDWLIIGPFDNEGMAGFDIAYPPEEQINLEATYSGKERPVGWREYPKLSYDCTVDLGATFRPNVNTAAYALACIYSPEPQPIAIRLGADDCAKVWVGTQLVHGNRDAHPLRFGQAVAPAVLEKGWNRLLVKVCQDEGTWAFRLRVTAPDGSALASLRHAAAKDEVAEALKVSQGQEKGAAAANVANASAPADPIAAFRKLAEADPDNAEHHAALSFLYSHAKAIDRKTRADVKELETAIRLAPEEWKYHFRLGELHEDENKKRAAYEKAAQLNPRHAPSLSRLGAHYAAKGLDRKSIRFYREAVEKDPSYYPAVLGVVRHLHSHSQKPEAARRFGELLRTNPDTPYLLSYSANFAPSPSTHEERRKAYEAALRFNACNRGVRRRLLSSCHTRNDLEGALRELDFMEQAKPLDTSVLLDHAELLADHDRYDEAARLVDRALEICPEDDIALKRKGELLLRRAKREEALAWFQTASAMKPQNRALREYIEFLKPREKPFEDAYKVDAAEAIAKAPPDVGEEGDSAAYLFDLWVREVHANGLSNSYHQEIVRILSEAGIQNFRFRRAVYRAGTTEIQVKAARVFKKDGRVINADGPFTYSYGGEDKIYYDLETKYVGFANLEPGDTIEFSYRANAIAPRNMYGDYFGDIVYLKDQVPKRSMTYVVIAPPGKKLYYKVVGMKADPVVETKDTGTVYTWQVRDIPKLESEPNMPGYSEVLPYVHVSTYEDWESVGEWYWNLIRDQFLLASTGRETVAKITGGLESEREKIVAIYNYVVQNTRYIGLEFGIHSHKPYPAYKVHARRYGDCKDKAGLMVTMLDEIGVNACMAVLRTKSRGKVEPHPASLAVFNHVICYVPKYDMWLDGTAEYAGSGELPYEDQGTDTLLVGKGVRKFATIPVVGGEGNLTSETYEATILPDGGIEFGISGEVIGQYASYFRSRFQEERDRENALARSWGTVLPNVRISEVDFGDLKDRERPVRYSFKAFAPNYAVADESGAMGFTGLIQKLYLTRRYASLSKRKYDLVLPFPWTLKASLAFKLPAGYKLVSVPEDMHLRTEFGKCDAEFVSTEPASVRVSFRFSLDVSRVKVEQYGAFRDFCRRIDEKLTEKIRMSQ